MKIQLITNASRRQPADLFITGFFHGEKISKEIEGVEPSLWPQLERAVIRGRFIGKSQSSFSTCQDNYKEAPEALIIGLGDKKSYKKTGLKKAIAQAVSAARQAKAVKVRFLMDSFAGGDIKVADVVTAFGETPLLCSYEFDKYKSKKENSKDESKNPEILEGLLLSEKGKKELVAALESSQVISEGVLFARDLINEPGNIMNAEKLVAVAEELAEKKNLLCRVLDESELKKLKMGGILAVNQGSVTPPSLITIEYGQKYKSNGTICLVGKGVTFDTGGISIKPAKDMEKMKYDMAGAAAVIATMGVVADLKPHLHIVGLTPVVENQVANNPQRPGDIIRMFNGKTVEVLNTDAEGRLILADALSYCERYEPNAIIDIATLTGMCAYTFGDKAIGLMGNDERLLDKVKKAGLETGERCWELPLWEEYAQQIKGHHSDLYNIGGPYAGTITAAMFLKEFLPGKTKWAHLDIAGTGWCDSSRYDCPKGATGVGVRLFVQLISDWM